MKSKTKPTWLMFSKNINKNRNGIMLAGRAVVIFSAVLLIFSAIPGANAFELKQRVFPAGKEATLRFRAANAGEKAALPETCIYYLRNDRCHTDGDNRVDRPLWERLNTINDGDSLLVKVRLNGEIGHTFRIGQAADANGRFARGSFKDIGVYSLNEDLFALRPFKGDFHMHSVACGHAKQEPRIVPALCRRAGFDFMSLTEHWRHATSLEAINAVKDWGSGLVAFPGEEFHSPNAILHSVAVGHSSGINDWMKQNPEENARLKKLELEKPLLKNAELTETERDTLAQAFVLYRRGHQLGGIISYSHPYGIAEWNRVLGAPERYINFMLENADFDAVELVHGTDPYALSISNARLAELRLKGRKFAFVGVSDAHDLELDPRFGRSYTIIFARYCDFPGFKKAIKNQLTVAVNAIGLPIAFRLRGPLLFGSSRLVKYGYFLQDNYWEYHDKLCQRQGELILKLLKGDTSVRPRIAELAEAIKQYRDEFFGTGNSNEIKHGSKCWGVLIKW
ncbi:MAG: hypothetical protein PHV59_04635 [Victivallales bacterium]|nr:hypothetical protein [Victivallales bacterium]